MVFKVKNPGLALLDNANVKDEFLVIKKQWSLVDQVKECQILKQFDGISYVPTVVAFQISASDATSRAEFNEWCISHLPGGEDIKSMVQRMERRKEVRVTMKPLGTPLSEFRSLKELMARVWVWVFW